MAGFRGRARRHLSLRGRTWWFKIAVPAALRQHFDGKTAVVESLETSDLRVAMERRDQRERELLDTFKTLKRGEEVAPIERGRLWREAAAMQPDEADLITDLAQEEAEKLTPEARQRFVIGFTGREAVGSRIDDWIREAGLADKTANEWRGLVMRFDRWASGKGHTMPDIDRKTAGQYVGEELAPMNRKTAAKHLSALRGYWGYLVRRGYVDEDTATIWDRQLQPQRGKRGKVEEEERAFTDDEVRVILYAEPKNGLEAELLPIAKVAALSGMRLDEVCGVKVVTGEDGKQWFDLRESKTQAGVRMVPVHPDLSGIVGDKDVLFPDARSEVMTKRFTRLRRRLKVTDTREGRRRDLVNFHSFRRWFVTKAEQAGVPEATVAAVVGHLHGDEKGKRTMTFGRYSGGSSGEQRRACVMAVKLPPRRGRNV